MITPATTVRPGHITPDLWDRMSWSARMRATRRSLHIVPAPLTDTGAEVTSQARALQGDVAASPFDHATAPVSPTSGAATEGEARSAPEHYPCAMLCGRWTRLVYCELCADLHRTEDATPPPLWLTAAWGNRLTLDRQARAYRGNVIHPLAGGLRHAPNRDRPVSP